MENHTIKFRVTEEELQQIDIKSNQAGFQNRSAFIRHKLLEENDTDITMAQACEIRGQLEKLKKRHSDDDITISCINNIHNILYSVF